MNKYFRKTLEYTAGNFFNKLIYFLLIPILSRQLIPEEYAVYSNITIFMSFASMIFLLGIQQALYSYFYENKSKAYQFTLISTVYLTLMFSGAIFTFIIILFSGNLSFLITRSLAFKSLIPLVAVSIFSDSIFAISLSFLNIQEKSTPFILLGSLKNILFLGLVTGFAVTSGITVFLLFYIMLGVSIVSSATSLIVILRIQQKYADSGIKLQYYSVKIIRNLLNFGLIMVPGTLAMMILRMSDRYMITWLSAGQLFDTGIYSIGYRIGLIMQFMVSLVTMVYFPYAMKISKRTDARESYGKAFGYFTVYGGILGLLIIMFGKELFHIFVDDSYFIANQVVFSGVMSAYILGLFNISNLTSYVEKRAKRIAFAVIIGAVINIVLNYFSILRFGIYGAAISSVISYLIILMINLIRMKKCGINLYRFWPVLLFIFLQTCFALFNVKVELSVANFIYKAVIALLLLGISIKLIIHDEYIREIIRQKKGSK